MYNIFLGDSIHPHKRLRHAFRHPLNLILRNHHISLPLPPAPTALSSFPQSVPDAYQAVWAAGQAHDWVFAFHSAWESQEK